MVAYSFKKRFGPPILAGTKAQTIRADRKRHARPGEELQLYTGMRTKHCKLLGRPTCVDVVPVRLGFHRIFGPLNFYAGGAHLSVDEMEAFARADGFGESGFAVLDMAAFWFATHLPEADAIDFHGVLIRWTPLVAADELDIAARAA